MSAANPIRRALSGILLFQFGLGLLLFWGDLQDGLRLPRLGPSAPALTEPIRPGDQIRRYRQDRAPAPGQPMPDTPPPDRLVLTPQKTATEVLLEGSVAFGDAERISKALAELEPTVETVLLNSPGGSVSDALALGRSIRAAGLNTALQPRAVCYSACPYILAAGVTRTVDSNASVGVHQHYFGENTLLPAFIAVEDIQRGQGEVMSYLDDMGIDLRVMQHALITPPDQIYVLVPEELREYRLTTGDAEG